MKPREFWIHNLDGYKLTAHHVPVISESPVYHVIDKTAYDKLVQELKYFADIRNYPAKTVRHYAMAARAKITLIQMGEWDEN